MGACYTSMYSLPACIRCTRTMLQAFAQALRVVLPSTLWLMSLRVRLALHTVRGLMQSMVLCC